MRFECMKEGIKEGRKDRKKDEQRERKNVWSITDVLYTKVKWKWESLSRFRLFATPWNTDHGILQARILEWVAFPFSRGSSQPRNWTGVSCIATELSGKPEIKVLIMLSLQIRQSHSTLNINYIWLKGIWLSIHHWHTFWLQASELKSIVSLLRKKREEWIKAWIWELDGPEFKYQFCLLNQPVNPLISKEEIKTESTSKVCWEH